MFHSAPNTTYALAHRMLPLLSGFPPGLANSDDGETNLPIHSVLGQPYPNSRFQGYLRPMLHASYCSPATGSSPFPYLWFMHAELLQADLMRASQAPAGKAPHPANPCLFLCVPYWARPFPSSFTDMRFTSLWPSCLAGGRLRRRVVLDSSDSSGAEDGEPLIHGASIPILAYKKHPPPGPCCVTTHPHASPLSSHRLTSVCSQLCRGAAQLGGNPHQEGN